MPSALKNILAVFAGLLAGGLVNMCLVMISASVIPPPAGVDVNDPASLATHIHLFGWKHFIFPFLAHALGTFAGAWVAARLAATRPFTWAMVIGAFNLLGGIVAASMIPAPMWFIVVDLLVAYLPMAWLGQRLASGTPR